MGRLNDMFEVDFRYNVAFIYVKITLLLACKISLTLSETTKTELVATGSSATILQLICNQTFTHYSATSDSQSAKPPTTEPSHHS